MRAALALALVLVASPAAQLDVSPQVRLRRVAEMYLSGTLDAALEALRKDENDVQRRTAREVVRTHGIAVGGTGPTRPNEPMWTVPLLRAAGAVHMEAALDLYQRGGRNLSAVMISQIEIGEILLDEVGRLEAKASDARRWEWLLGERALSEAQFNLALAVLSRACQRYPGQASLLVACGTVYEAYASFNVDSSVAAQAVGVMTPTNSEPSTRALLGFRAARTDNLKRARDAFDEALALEPADVEAILRLGKVRLEQGDFDAAAKRLESLVRLKTDRRVSYLSRLFLGRVREKQKRFDEAIVLFREATNLVAAQSGRLALANRLHAAGRNPDARALAEAVTSDRGQEDPWWSYRLGQYWLVEPTLDALRHETRAAAQNKEQ